jgi:drug/metabolite transporter (DMT)-like permease
VLGVIFSILSAATFALNNAAVRRGVVTGTPSQAMAVNVPIGIICFLPLTLLLGELGRIGQFPPAAMAWMAGLGVLHFVIGRYCNFKSSQLAGVNLTAPVIQLQAVVTMVLAVAILGEPCTLFQALGGAVMISGSLITQRQPPSAASKPNAGPRFVPLYLAGYFFASMAALSYGTTPVMARFALADTGPSTGILGGLISYIAATSVAALALLSPSVRRNVRAVTLSNAKWFALSGVMVAAAQAFFFCAISLAPVLVVMPLLQVSLLFRILFSTWLSPDHEVFGRLVLAGVGVSLTGAMLVSVDTGLIVRMLAVPDTIARVLLWRVG